MMRQRKTGRGVKWLNHYSSAQSILVVGDGDYSFSLALATAFGSGENLVPTSLDSYEALTSKYGKAESNVAELKRLGAIVFHGVDANTMKLHPCLKMGRFDRIVFNFPHAGFKGKENHLHMINLHKQLVNGFFGNARHLLQPYGEIHLSHKTGHPYDAWDIEQLAYQSSLIMVGKVDFCKEDYPGYNQKRGDSAMCDQPFALGPCCTFMFCIGDVNRIGSIPSLGDSKFYPGILTTNMGPFDLQSLAPAWPRPHFPLVNRVHVPITFDPDPFGVAQMEHPSFPVYSYGTERAPYLPGHDLAMCSITEPPLNVLPTQGGFHPPMSRISSATIRAHPEQPWYQGGPPVEPPWRGDYSYSAEEYQKSLHREYEIQRQLIPGGTCLGYSAFPEHRFRESVQNREHLEMLIALSLGYSAFPEHRFRESVQNREHLEMLIALSLGYSAFPEHRFRESVQNREHLKMLIALSLGYSAFPEHRFRESVQNREHLEMLIALSLGYSAFPEHRFRESVQNREHLEMLIALSLGYSAFPEHRFRESVQNREHLEMLIALYGRQ